MSVAKRSRTKSKLSPRRYASKLNTTRIVCSSSSSPPSKPAGTPQSTPRRHAALSRTWHLGREHKQHPLTSQGVHMDIAAQTKDMREQRMRAFSDLNTKITETAG